MNSTTPDFTWLFLKMVFGLVLVLGLIFFLLRYVLPRTRMGQSGTRSWMKMMERVSVGPQAHLTVVKILERYFILGVTENSVNLVTELSKEEGEKIEED